MTTRGVAVVSCVLAVAGGVLGCVGDSPLPTTGFDGGSDAASDGSVTDGSTTPDGAPTGDGGTCDGVSQCLGTILGWAPVSFAEGSTVACPQGTVEIRRGGTNPPSGLACSACACGSATCSSSTIELYSPSSSCGDPQPAVTLSVGANACLNAQQSSIMYSVRFTPGKTSCPASGGAKAPFAWGKNSLTCTTVIGGGTCNGGACFAKPDTAELCLSQDGDVACPSPSYTKHLFHTGVLDSTQCSPCTCNGDGASCSGNAGIFFSPNCTNPFNTVNPIAAGCKQTFGGNTIGSFQSTVGSAGCTPVGGQASGTIAVDPAKAVTVCCPK